jgi:hypothetical protein
MVHSEQNISRKSLTVLAMLTPDTRGNRRRQAACYQALRWWIRSHVPPYVPVRKYRSIQYIPVTSHARKISAFTTDGSIYRGSVFFYFSTVLASSSIMPLLTQHYVRPALSMHNFPEQNLRHSGIRLRLNWLGWTRDSVLLRQLQLCLRWSVCAVCR